MLLWKASGMPFNLLILPNTPNIMRKKTQNQIYHIFPIVYLGCVWVLHGYSDHNVYQSCCE